MARTWRDLLRSLGDSLLEVVEAEVAALKSDLGASGRRLQAALVLGGLAVFLLFWAVGAAGLVLFQVMTIWLPAWGAALVVFAVFFLLALILALVTRQRLRAIEPPVDTVRRRFDDHAAWWQSHVLVQEGPGPDSLEETERGEMELPDKS